MNTQRLIAFYKRKEAIRNLIRGMSCDLSEWGLKGDWEQVTRLLLRFEKFQEDMGERPAFNAWPKDPPHDR